MSKSRTKCVFSVVDTCVVTLAFTPLVVSYWHGTWALLDSYLLPQDLKTSSWISLIIGGAMCTILYLLQTFLKEHTEKCNIVLWILCSRVYTYVFGIGSVNYWRGVWYLLNEYTGTGVASSLISAALGTGVLLFLRSSRTVHVPPTVIAYDVGLSYFDCSTRFQVKAGLNEKYILDTILTTVIIHGLVVFYWRGLYEFQTNVLFPGDPALSALASMVIGHVVFVLMLFLQHPVSKISARLDKKPFFYKLLLEDLFQLVLNISGVCIWRGWWESCKLFIWPDDVIKSGWFTHALGIFTLMACLVGNTVISRGCDVDGDYSDGKGVLIDTAYYNFFREYFSNHKAVPSVDEKKQHLVEESSNTSTCDSKDCSNC